MTPLVAYKTGRKLGRLAPYPGQIIGYGKRGPIRAVFGGTGPVVVQFVDITNASSGNYTSNITAGNSVFVWVQAYDTANSPITTSAVTVAGQSLTKLIEINTPYNGQLQYFSIWGAANSPGGAKTVSATMSGGIINPGSGLKVMEVSGLGKNWVVDRTASASSGTGTAVASGSTSATRYANELVLFALAVANGTTGTPTGPATNSDMGGFPYFWNGYTIATTSGSTYSISATDSSTGPWGAAALTISAQVSASGGVKLKKLKTSGSVWDPSVVQTKAGGGSGISGTLTITLDNSTAAGNTLIVAIGNNSSTTDPSSVTLGGVNLTEDAVKVGSSANQDTSFWSLRNIAAGQTSVVITHSGTWSPGVVVLEIPKAWKFDVASAGGTSAAGSQSTFDSGTASTNVANELWLGVAVTFGTSGHTTIQPTADVSWISYADESEGSFTDVVVAHQKVSATGTIQFSGTLSPAAADWTALTAAYKFVDQVTGALKLKKLKVAGTSTEKSAATGALKLKKLVVAGSGTASGGSSNIVTAAISLKKLVVAGTSTEKSAATGAISLKKMVVAGTSTEKSVGTGAIKLKKMVVAGTSTEKTVGTAAIHLKKMVVAGASTEKSAATAAVKLKKMVVAGSSTEKSVVTAAVKLKKMVVLGSEFEVARFSGGVNLKKMVVAGSSTEKSAATASLRLKKMVVAGTSIEKTVAVGSIHLKKMRISGSSTEESVATVALHLKKFRISISGAQGHTAAKSSQLFIFSPL